VLVIEGVDVWHVERVYDPQAQPPERSENTPLRETAAIIRS
jgi:hypothetical protein